MVMLYRGLAKDILTERDAHSHRRFIDWFEIFNTQSSIRTRSYQAGRNTNHQTTSKEDRNLVTGFERPFNPKGGHLMTK